jgi:hypothetical protein
MNTQMKPCCECKDTFEDDDLKKCESCEFFVCFDCIQSCGLVIDHGLGDDDYECGDDGSVLHEGCNVDQLEVCDCDGGSLSTTRCETTGCQNHIQEAFGGCMDCDQFRCPNCVIQCQSCYSGSCMSSDCGGICDSCEAEFCEDDIKKCPFSNCSRQFCFYEVRVDFPFLHRLWRRIIRGKTIAWRWKDAGCSVKNNMQYCETDDGYFCIDHIEHKCAV